MLIGVPTNQFVSDWRQLIHVGAIDCAEERNLAICVHYKIEGYPTVKVSPSLWSFHSFMYFSLPRVLLNYQGKYFILHQL